MATNPIYGQERPELFPNGEACCAEQFGKGVVEVLGDEPWMSLITAFIGIGSNACSLIDAQAEEFVPYLGIISGPLHLYHSVSGTIKKFKLAGSAVKTGRVADALFWVIGGIGYFGIALSNVIRPVAGGVVLLGLTHIVELQMIFSSVVPIVLIALSSIGGLHQVWSLGRTESAREAFEKRRFHLKNFNDLIHLLADLQGVQKPLADEDSSAMHEYKLEEERQNILFTSCSRREAVQTRIKEYMRKQELAKEKLQLILYLMEKTQTQSMDETLELSDQTIALAEQEGIDVKDLKEGKAELIKLKELCEEGYGILDTVESEIHRKIANQNLLILSILLTLGAAVILLFAPESEHYLGYALSISSSAIGVFTVAFDKGVSQEEFLKLEQFFGTIRSRIPFLKDEVPALDAD